ncbi:hypothetical protein AMC78_CH00548 [Rhizobium phaseoli]|uniref:hypothetical protein n=1 Tax=Rhizobium phaseoli TaxID=396 RepID=UPI0007EB63D9|nr:hypothetical protein [Rhizobium phaseoli]ANM02696.1 hypothetical protein AMC78_CH00548 [Rhizobium phaseoli]
MRILLSSVVLFTLTISNAHSEDFPLASCAGWDGKLISRTGTDSRNAVMEGNVNQANFQEYCERDPGYETVAHGGKLTVEQCVALYMKEDGEDTYRSTADCRKGTLSFFPSAGEPVRVTFPLPEDADISCASGMPPLIRQFTMLCPQAARKFKMLDDE